MATTLRNWTILTSLLPSVAGLTVLAEEPPFERAPMVLPAPAESNKPAAEAPLEVLPAPSVAPSPQEEHSPQHQAKRGGESAASPQSTRRPPLDRGFPERLHPPALGSSIMRFQLLQIAQGQAARMALYQYDFLPDSPQLNPRGHHQLTRIAHWAGMNPFPIFVEPVRGCPELTELRRQAVWHQLSLVHGEFPIERVLVGCPVSRGLDAMDALSIDHNRNELTNSRGISAGGTEGTGIMGGIGTDER